LRRVLLLATTTGYQIRSFGAAARQLGVRLVFASDRCDQLDDPWWDGAIPVRFHDEAAAVDAIVAGLAARPDGILAVGDRPTSLAAQVARRFCMPGNAPEAAAASRNKLATRAALLRAGLPTPSFRLLEQDEDSIEAAGTVTYPAVVKPVALSGSRGVMRVDDAAGCAAAIARLRLLLRAPDIVADRDPVHRGLVVEAFIPGREYAVEGLLTDGALRVLAIFDKPDPLDGPFFEETIYLTPSREPAGVQQQIVAAIGDAARAIGLTHGPVHAECRVNERGVFVLEVAARPIGGLCSAALRFTGPGARGCSLEEILLRHALGEDVASYQREASAAGVMMIPIPGRGVLRRVEGVAAARAIPDVSGVTITAKPDALLVPLPEGRSYVGFIFAGAETPEAVDRALRAAHAALRFVVDKEIPICGSGGPTPGDGSGGSQDQDPLDGTGKSTA
jgi:biotin carboxylase